jgi:hypothetical protein
LSQGEVLPGILPVDVEALGASKTAGSRFAEPSSSSRFAPAGTGTPPISTAWVVWRRQAMTGESKRSTSSKAFGMREASRHISSQA